MSVLALIVFSSTLLCLLPTVSGAEQNLESKTLSVLSDVIGLKTELYTSSHCTQQGGQYLGQTQNITDLYLASAQDSLRVTCSYIKNNLQLVYFSDLEGAPQLKKPAANTVEMAAGLLGRYGNYSNDSLYGQLASMLLDVNEKENLTKNIGNIKFQVRNSDGNLSTYTWTYVDNNGVLAERKNIVLTYREGLLEGFYNNWPLYTIADTAPKLSAQQATELAMEASKNYSYPVTYQNGTKIMVSGLTDNELATLLGK
jgi:hypothetical protein